MSDGGAGGPGDRVRDAARRIADVARRLPVRRPWTVVAIALLLALAGAYVYFFQLDIVATRGALADPDREFNQRWRDYQESFGGERDFLVLVLAAPRDGDDSLPPLPDAAQRTAMREVADRWARELRERPDLFPEVNHRIDPDALGEYALLYLPHRSLETLAGRLELLLPAVESAARNPTPSAILARIRGILDGLEAPADTTGSDAAALRGTVDALEAFFRWFRRSLEQDAGRGRVALGSRELLGALVPGGMDPEGYLFVGEGRLLTVLADTEEDATRRNRYEPAMAYARAALDSALAPLPDSVRLEAGLTGEPALEYQETVTSQRDFGRSTVLALVLVSVLFMWAFRTVLRPGLAAVCLGMSIAMTFGVAWLAVGHLNVLAMVFAVILVALGIDFAIHFYTHYRRGLELGYGPGRAIDYTYSAVGKALWLAGIATSAAFFSAYFTDFPGLSELGVIAGSGLLVCLACMFFVFPALLGVVDRRWPSPALPDRRPFRWMLKVVRPSASRRKKAYVVGAVALGALGFGFGQYAMDTNLLALQPAGGSATAWQDLLIRTEDRTSYALATYEDRSALERAREALRASAVVDGTEAAFPAREEEKRALLDPLCERIRAAEVMEAEEVSVRETRRELFGIRQTLRRYAGTGTRAEEALSGVSADVEGAYRALGGLAPETARARLAAVGSTLRGGLAAGVREARSLLCPSGLTLARVPDPFRSRFVGDDGTLALRIYPARDTWTTEDLEWFVEGAREVEPAIFGGVVNVYENARAMVASFVQAAGYSSAAILALLLLWSRSVRTTALAVLPLVVGVGLLLGLMRWGPFSIRWNLANLFAVPILIGIGIDGGVHLVQAWRSGGRETFLGAAEAVLMSALTTMIGFGLLATGDHAGVSSLGLIVFLGIGINLLACLTVLPPALAWFGGEAAEEGGRQGGAPPPAPENRGRGLEPEER